MTVMTTADRVVVSVTATDSGNWQVVSVPTGFQGIVSTLFSENDYLCGFVRHEDGEQWEVYDHDDDDDSHLLQVTSISGTVVLARPGTPNKSSKSDGTRMDAGSGTHTLALSLGADTLKRMMREASPFWKTLASGDSTPSVADYRFFTTDGSTAITRFDDLKNGQRFVIRRGSGDIVIQHDGTNIVLFGGVHLTLTAPSPVAEFAVENSVAKQIGGAAPGILATRANLNGLKDNTVVLETGADEIVVTIADAADNATPADSLVIPRIKGAYLLGVYETATELKAIDAAKYAKANQRALCLGRADGGDTAPFYVEWLAANADAGDDWLTFRPSTGAASSGNGRWKRVTADVTQTVTNSATPSIASGNVIVLNSGASDPVTDVGGEYSGARVTLVRGDEDVVITHDATKIYVNGRANKTLTLDNPVAVFESIGGVWREVGAGNMALKADAANGVHTGVTSIAALSLSGTPGVDGVFYGDGSNSKFGHDIRLSTAVNNKNEIGLGIYLNDATTPITGKGFTVGLFVYQNSAANAAPGYAANFVWQTHGPPGTSLEVNLNSLGSHTGDDVADNSVYNNSLWVTGMNIVPGGTKRALAALHIEVPRNLDGSSSGFDQLFNRGVNIAGNSIRLHAFEDSSNARVSLYVTGTKSDAGIDMSNATITTGRAIALDTGHFINWKVGGTPAQVLGVSGTDLQVGYGVNNTLVGSRLLAALDNTFDIGKSDVRWGKLHAVETSVLIHTLLASAAPSAPPAGACYFYMNNSTGKACIKDSAGVEHALW